MRKNIFICICVLLFLCFLLILNFGLHLGFTKILSYDEIEEANINKKILLAEFDDKVNNEYKNKENEFKQVVEEYKNSKNEFDNLVNLGKINDNSIQQYLNLYNFDEVNAIIDEYAKEKNVETNFNIKNSETNFAINSEYVVCDICFIIKGEYIDITDFIYSIEDDDRLNFEINDFEMTSVNNTLEAKFNVKNIPILNKDL